MAKRKKSSTSKIAARPAPSDERSPRLAVFFHGLDPEKAATADWENKTMHFDQIPAVGEYVALDDSSPWYRVEVVTHCPWSPDFAAEIHASLEKDAHLESLRRCSRKPTV